MNIDLYNLILKITNIYLKYLFNKFVKCPALGGGS